MSELHRQPTQDRGREDLVATIALDNDNFDETVSSNGTVLVDFWASWCGPCRVFAPIFDASSAAHPDLVFGKVDTEDQQELAARFGIRSIPTLMAFRDGILLYAQPGALPGHALEELVAKVQELDMDEVRRELDRQNRAAS